jgi:hypothetical protein
MELITTKYLTYGILLLSSLFLGGCSIVQSVGSFLADLGTPKTTLTQISIVTKYNANSTSATAVDIVFIYNDKVNALLPKKAINWFSNRDELRVSLKQYIDIASIEIPPTFLLDSVPLPDRHSNAVKVITYANYLDKKGLRPIDLTTYVHPLIILEAKTIKVTEQN